MADPITLVAGGGAVVSGVLGAIAQMDANARAQMLQDRSFQEWLKINIPDPNEQKLALEQFVVAGKLTPAMETAIKQEPSAFENVVEDKRTKTSRLRSLKSLEDLGTGAETFEDKAGLAKALIQSGAKSRGAQKLIESQIAQRGQMGTGLELVAKMDQAQADADRAGTQALDIESNRRLRSLKALESAGNLAGDIGDDDYRMKSDRARAADEISSFNTRNMQDVLSRNTAANNRAAEYNLNNEQDVANKNTSLSNYEQEFNKGLTQKKFENETTLAAGKSGQYAGAAKTATDAGKNAAEFWGTLAGNVPKVATALKGSTSKTAEVPDRMVDDEEDWSKFYA